MKTKSLLWIVWVAAVLFIGVQPSICEEIKGIKNLRLICSSDAIINGIEIYELTAGYKYTVEIKPFGRSYDEAKKKTISDEQVKEIIDVLNKYEVWKWDGFRQYDPNIRGGESFSISLITQDDKTISANGYEMYPKHYDEVIQELLPIFGVEEDRRKSYRLLAEVREIDIPVPITVEKIKKLHYSYSSGYAVNSNEIYELTCGNECNVKIKPYGQPYEEAKTYPVSDEQVKELIDIFNKYEIWKWNGFDEHNSDVRDGSSFSFSLVVQDGKTITADGYEEYPENYGIVVQELLRVLNGDDEDNEEKEEKAAPVRITVEEIKYLSYSYSGSSVYGTAVYELDGRFAIIQHWSLERAEEPEQITISDEQMKELIDVFNKYEVWKWDGFEEYDPDASDGANFSFSLTVQDGKTITADGHGIYPENYWEVIKELNRIFEKDNVDKGNNGVLVPVIIGAVALVIILVVLGIIRKRKDKVYSA